MGCSKFCKSFDIHLYFFNFLQQETGRTADETTYFLFVNVNFLKVAIEFPVSQLKSGRRPCQLDKVMAMKCFYMHGWKNFTSPLLAFLSLLKYKIPLIPFLFLLISKVKIKRQVISMKSLSWFARKIFWCFSISPWFGLQIGCQEQEQHPIYDWK